MGGQTNRRFHEAQGPQKSDYHVDEVAQGIRTMARNENGLHESPVTRILSSVERGDPQAADQLLPLIYNELRQLAEKRLQQVPAGQSVQATGLVHEAYVRLVDVDKAQRWDSRWHFFAAAAEAMRRILVENARRKARRKHGGKHHRVDLYEECAVEPTRSGELLALDEALVKLEEVEPAKANLVKLRYFAGMSEEEAANALGISRATASRWWTYARTWLHHQIQKSIED